MNNRNKQLVAGGLLLFIAFTIHLRGRHQVTPEEFSDLSRGNSWQNEETKRSQKNQKRFSARETYNLTPELRQIISKTDEERATGRYQDSLQTIQEGREKYPLNYLLFEREFIHLESMGEDPRNIFFDYIERLDSSNPHYHLAWYFYYAHKRDYSLATESLQKSIELEANDGYKVQRISKLATTQHNMGRYEDSISSSNRYFELRSSVRPAPGTEGKAYSIRGASKRLSGKYSIKEWCMDIRRAHNIGWRMDVRDRNPDPTNCPI